MMLNINGKTKQLALIGNPVGHSLSPMIHNFISEQLGNNYVYTAFCVDNKDVKAALDGMRALGICGFNVTAPHKQEVMKYLDWISEDSRLQGSVNTIVNDNGVLKGYTTDADGFYKSLVASGIEVRDKRILVLGAGGVAKPIAMRLIKEKPSSVTILNRTPQKACELAKELYNQMGYEVLTSADVKAYDLVINTTSAGMGELKNVLPTDSISELSGLDFINKNTAVADLIYKPRKTLFLQECEKRGAKILNGLGMLIYQAVISYELFTNTAVSDEIVAQIKEKIFGSADK